MAQIRKKKAEDAKHRKLVDQALTKSFEIEKRELHAAKIDSNASTAIKRARQAKIHLRNLITELSTANDGLKELETRPEKANIVGSKT